jgi:hypothetical protein
MVEFMEIGYQGIRKSEKVGNHQRMRKHFFEILIYLEDSKERNAFNFRVSRTVTQTSK